MKFVVLSACKKTADFKVFDKETSKARLSKFLKTRSLLIVNDCFKNEGNAEISEAIHEYLKISKL